jgi:hypothetical protein
MFQCVVVWKWLDPRAGSWRMHGIRWKFGLWSCWTRLNKISKDERILEVMIETERASR